jgi:hypothetical protein
LDKQQQQQHQIKYGAWISGFVINLRLGSCETFQAACACCCTGRAFQNFFSYFKALIPRALSFSAYIGIV